MEDSVFDGLEKFCLRSLRVSLMRIRRSKLLRLHLFEKSLKGKRRWKPPTFLGGILGGEGNLGAVGWWPLLYPEEGTVDQSFLPYLEVLCLSVRRVLGGNLLGVNLDEVIR